jgi:hypothetical protein
VAVTAKNAGRLATERCQGAWQPWQSEFALFSLLLLAARADTAAVSFSGGFQDGKNHGKRELELAD